MERGAAGLAGAELLGAMLQRLDGLDVERLKDSSEQHALEKEWLYWMVNGFADPVVLVNADNDIILQNLRAATLFKANSEASEGKRRAMQMNNFLFTAALSTSNLEQNAAGRSARKMERQTDRRGTPALGRR